MAASEILADSVDRVRLGHVHLEVRDLERSVRHYRDLLGLEVTERTGRFAFLSFGRHHHDVALQQVSGDRLGRDGESRPGLYHVAFEVSSLQELERVVDHLRSQGQPHELIDHGISLALYTRDPDGHGVEVYVDRRQEPSGRDVWNGVSHGAAL